MEPDNITICEALRAFGIKTTGQLAKIMATDHDHIRSLVAQIEENKRYAKQNACRKNKGQ